jgi:hypothetical protein
MPSIKVVYRGRALSGERVHISWSSGGTTSGRTDSNGVFTFSETGYGKVYIEGNNREVFDGMVDGMLEVNKTY